MRRTAAVLHLEGLGFGVVKSCNTVRLGVDQQLKRALTLPQVGVLCLFAVCCHILLNSLSALQTPMISKYRHYRRAQFACLWRDKVVYFISRLQIYDFVISRPTKVLCRHLPFESDQIRHSHAVCTSKGQLASATHSWMWGKGDLQGLKWCNIRRQKINHAQDLDPLCGTTLKKYMLASSSFSFFACKHLCVIFWAVCPKQKRL